nr:PREDICTED: 39S ribosomal protein L20, mitochondrial [Bemisia tabaci]
MVFPGMALLQRAKGPDSFWKKRRLFRLTAHFRGRNRNVWTLVLRNVKRALVRATKGRIQRKKDMHDLRVTRITAAVEEHGFTQPLFADGLNRSRVYLDTKVLADLSIWEPRTFKALTHLAWSKTFKDRVEGVDEQGTPPANVAIKDLKDS